MCFTFDYEVIKQTHYDDNANNFPRLMDAPEYNGEHGVVTEFSDDRVGVEFDGHEGKIKTKFSSNS